MSHHHHCAAASSSRFFTQWQCSKALTRTSHRASSSGTSWTGTGWRPPPSRSQGLPCRCQSPPGRSPWTHLEGTGNHGCDVQQSRRLVWVMWPEVKSSDGCVRLHISNLAYTPSTGTSSHKLNSTLQSLPRTHSGNFLFWLPPPSYSSQFLLNFNLYIVLLFCCEFFFPVKVSLNCSVTASFSWNLNDNRKYIQRGATVYRLKHFFFLHRVRTVLRTYSWIRPSEIRSDVTQTKSSKHP